jgi:hypothetical protein
MSRICKLLMLSLGILSTQVAAAKVTISSVPGSKHPGIAWSGQRYLACWVDPRNGWNDIYAHRVTSDMDIEDPVAIEVARGIFCCSLDVASDGDDFLVAWENTVSGVDHDIGCCVVRGIGYAEDVEVVAEGSDLKQAPSVAFASPNQGPDCYLVAWLDHRDGVPEIYVARVSRDGDVLDPGGHLLVQGRDVVYSPSVASDGEKFLIVWYERTGGQPRLYGQSLSTELEVDEPHCIYDAALRARPDVAFAACLQRYVVVWLTTSPTWTVYARTCLASGEPEHDVYWIHFNEDPKGRPRCAASDVNAMAIWD